MIWLWSRLCHRCKKNKIETLLTKPDRQMIDVECPVCNWIWKGKNPKDIGDVNETDRSICNR